MSKSRLILISSLIAGFTLLSACGQKGALFIEKEASPETVSTEPVSSETTDKKKAKAISQ